MVGGVAEVVCFQIIDFGNSFTLSKVFADCFLDHLDGLACQRSSQKSADDAIIFENLLLQFIDYKCFCLNFTV